MAEPTKAEIQKERDHFEKIAAEKESELNEFKVEYEDMKTKYESSPYATDANYQREIERLTKRAQSAESELKALNEKTTREQRERDQIAEDQRIEEERRLKQFGILSVDQSEHTRFRITSRPPRGQRDVFGDPESEVVNLGVELDDYSGGLYIPVWAIIEIGQSFGMLTAEQAAELKAELDKTKSQVEKAGALAQELISGIQANVDRFYVELDSVVPDVDDSESTKSNAGESSTKTTGSNLAGDSTPAKAGSLFGSLK